MKKASHTGMNPKLVLRSWKTRPLMQGGKFQQIRLTHCIPQYHVPCYSYWVSATTGAALGGMGNPCSEHCWARKTEDESERNFTIYDAVEKSCPVYLSHPLPPNGNKRDCFVPQKCNRI